ncbi:hypothetical protein BVC80_1039g24 [Macleaya cordata]|uniref:Uncharacterized protein n=1 Tax=Macleaya cordata TaxID=56857 RepID=A0A200QVS5_MACCD|nr:hypothetical protein BVC80_1039g24 [Macleaya cordata]
MSVQTTRLGVKVVIIMILAVFVITAPSSGLNSEKIDDNLVPGPPDSGIKCTACSTCENPCNQYPPPPPPSPPPPPPPSRNPPPSENPPNKPYCPPPPPPPLNFVVPPGNLYPIDPDFSSAGMDPVNKLLVLVGCCLFGLLSFWRL